MCTRSVRRSRRAASGLMPLVMLVFGVFILGAGIYIGTKLSNARAADQAEAAAETAVAKTTANTPADPSFEGDDYDESAEEAARREQARLQGEPPAQDSDDLPPVSLDPPMLDLGIVTPGRLVTGTVQIRNDGDEPLLIETSKASCSCTAVDMSNTWIQPGESAPMDATFTKQTLGEKKAAVRLKFRGYNAVVTVDLKATVAMAVMAEPAYISASFDSETRMTEVSSGQITIRSLDERPFRILAIDGAEPNYINFNPDTDEPRNSYEIGWDLSDVDDKTCRRSDGSKVRRFWAVETDHPDCPIFDMQVRHICTLPEKLVDRRWVLTPHRVLLGELRPGESTEVDVLMNWLPHSKHNEQVHTVLAQSPHITVEVVEFTRARGQGSEDSLRLRVTVNEDIPGGLIFDKSRVHTRTNNAPLYLIGRVAR